MGRGKDKMWKYCHIGENKRVKCMFCQKDFTGEKTMMKIHLAKIEGNNIQPCPNVTDNVMEEARNYISVLQRDRAIRAREKNVPLPLPNVSSLVWCPAVKRRFAFISELDKSKDGDSMSAYYNVPAIANALKLENEYFHVVMQPSYREYLPIPIEFGKKYFPDKLENVKLSYSGKTWTLGYWNDGKQYILKKGWPACSREMGVKDDSFCLFEIFKSEEIVLKVYIISERKSLHETGESIDASCDKSSDDDDDQIHSRDEYEYDFDSKTSQSCYGRLEGDLPKSKGNTEMFDALYTQIASRYGRLEGDLPTSLRTTSAMTEDILTMILEMSKTKPSELSVPVLAKWEQIVQYATALKFNVGWLANILARIRRTLNSNVKLLEEKVETLKKNGEYLEEELKKVRKDLEIAISDLEMYKISEVTGFFYFDCTMLTS
ncbi:hypothetical protein ACHQM5_027212 [Ranunculus cassubicifolius]